MVLVDIIPNLKVLERGGNLLSPGFFDVPCEGNEIWNARKN
jgi:hypothetical protein